MDIVLSLLVSATVRDNPAVGTLELPPIFALVLQNARGRDNDVPLPVLATRHQHPVDMGNPV